MTAMDRPDDEETTEGAEATPDSGGGSLQGRVEAVLALIRPMIQADGGDVELVDIEPDGTAVVRLLGACIGCPSSSITLQHGIERQLRERIPEILAVRAVDDS